MNTPYIKQYDENGMLLNLITKDKPYLHKHKSARGKSGPVYVYFHHPITGEFIGKVKAGGNNRKWKDGKPRNYKAA